MPVPHHVPVPVLVHLVRVVVSVPALWCRNLAGIPGLTGFGIWMQKNPNSGIIERPLLVLDSTARRRGFIRLVAELHSVSLGSFQGHSCP